MKYVAQFDGEQLEFAFERTAEGLVAHCGDKTWKLDLSLVGDGSTFSLLVDSKSYDVVTDVDGTAVMVQMIGERYVVEVEDERERAAHALVAKRPGGKRELHASMPGIVVDIKVEAGAEVEDGQPLIVLEAMKMQNPLCAEAAGKVARILCKTGEAVAAGALLIEME